MNQEVLSNRFTQKTFSGLPTGVEPMTFQVPVEGHGLAMASYGLANSLWGD